MAAAGATRPFAPRPWIRRASRLHSSCVDMSPMSVVELRRGRVRGGWGSSIDQRDRAISGKSCGSEIPSCLRQVAALGDLDAVRQCGLRKSLRSVTRGLACRRVQRA
jgi:hypothetical protein